MREWPELIVSGCTDATISNIVKGTYRVDSMNHSKPVYKKYEKAKGLDVLVYFWDDRDGLELCGWWFGPSVGGDQVWAFHPSRTSTTPPASEWNIPNDGPIDSTFTITPRTKAQPRDDQSDETVRKQIENMKKEREQFASRMDEIQRRADERRRREEELKKRMRDMEEDGTKPAKRLKSEESRRREEDDEEHRRRKEAAIANARAEEERRRLEDEARQKKEEERRRMEEELRQKREEERRRLDEEAQRRQLERQRQEEETSRKRTERRRKEEEEERKRREVEFARRREEEDRKRKEEAKRHEERQRRLNEEAKKRKEDVSVLGMIEALARLSSATLEDFDSLKLMFEKALELLLPYTGKQKSTLKGEAERVLLRTESYIKQAQQQKDKWEVWYELQQRVPLSMRG